MKRKTTPQNNFSSSGVPTVQTKFSSLRRGFRRCKPSLVLLVGNSDSANQVQFSLSGVPTAQTKFSSLRREFRQCKPSLILFVGSSDSANQVQYIADTSILLVSASSIKINLQMGITTLFFVSTSETLATTV